MKKLITMFMAVAIILSMAAIPALAAENLDADISAATPRVINAISITGDSGTRYYVNVTADIVGYNNITTGGVVKVCQAFCKAAGHSPGTVDGIFGQNTYTAVFGTQGDIGVSQDGVCGVNTWRGVYDYVGGATATVKSYL